MQYAARPDGLVMVDAHDQMDGLLFLFTENHTFDLLFRLFPL